MAACAGAAVGSVGSVGALAASGTPSRHTVRGWLREAVHGRGCLLETDDLLVAASGKPLGAEDFLSHLRLRYLGEG